LIDVSLVINFCSSSSMCFNKHPENGHEDPRNDVYY
jgi:hypothetical protein